MAVLITDANGNFVPQYLNVAGTTYEEIKGKSNAQFIQSIRSGTQIGTDQTLIWANSDPINTEYSYTFTLPSTMAEKYELVVCNTSTLISLTVKIYNIETSLGGSNRDSLVTTKHIDENGTYTIPLEDIFNNTNTKMVFSNNIEVGATGTFSIYFRLKEK